MTPASSFPRLRDRAGRRLAGLLRDRIVRGRLRPGERLTEDGIGELLGASRTPVREALHQLRREGLVVPVRGDDGGRTRLAVAPLSVAQMTELYQLAAALEGLAGRQAALLPPARRKELAMTMAAADRGLQTAARERPLRYDRMFERHDAFHRAFVEVCAGPETRALLETLRPHLDRYEWYYAPLVGPDFDATFREHARMVRAVRSGDADAIESAVRANWINGAERLARAMTVAPRPESGP